MSKKNRKRNSRPSMAGSTCRWLSFAIVAVSISLLYVWQHVQLVHTGYRLKNLEKELSKCRKTNATLTLMTERLKRPRRIEESLARDDNRLGFPDERNVVRLRDPRRKTKKEKGASGYKGGTDTLLSYIVGRGGAGQSI